MTCAYRAHRVRSRLATPIVLRPVVALSRSLCCCYGWCEALVTCPTVPLVLSFNNFSRMHKKWTNFSINCYQKQFKYFIARQTGDSGGNRCENKNTKWKTYCGATREVRSTTAQYPVSLLRCLSFYFFCICLLRSGSSSLSESLFECFLSGHCSIPDSSIPCIRGIRAKQLFKCNIV